MTKVSSHWLNLTTSVHNLGQLVIVYILTANIIDYYAHTLQPGF